MQRVQPKAEEAKGKLAGLAILKYASIVGSHANHACRSVYHGISHPDDTVTIDGMLSLDKLSNADPAWCAAIRDGMDWMVVPYRVVDASTLHGHCDRTRQHMCPSMFKAGFA